MSSMPPPSQYKVPSPEQTLRKLFLTVFLRGQSARGQTKESTPKTIASKLGLTLGTYGMMGLLSLFMIGQPVLMLSISMHSMTFLALGMFVAGSAGVALFNKEESEILMHRPVTSQMLLRAKATVLVQIGLCVAGALNLAPLFVGVMSSNGGWLFPFAHIASTIEEALFCIGVVVLMYQLCLRWFGRERLDGFMTTMQVVVMVGITVGSQILPRAIGMNGGIASVRLDAWWLKILPPTWFASFDDAVAGTRSSQSWMLAAVGLVVTAAILWIGFGRLASAYESGVQSLNETARPKKTQGAQFRFVKALSESMPLRWFLKNSVAKASFQLVAAYMFRDRDTKLRLYPGLAPMMIMPVMLIVTNHHTGRHGVENDFTHGMGQFDIAMAAAYLCLVPLTALNLLKFSQQYRAADVFVAAPILGPAPILQGARVAVVTFLTLPLLAGLSIFAVVTQGGDSLWFVLVGAIALPIYTLIPGATGDATPLSNPIEEAKSARNMPVMMLSLFGAIGLAGAATGASALGFFFPFLAVEMVVSLIICYFLQLQVAKRKWRLYD